MQAEYVPQARVFKAFCDENRLAALVLLKKNGEMCACKLQDALGIGQSTLSHHMRILTESGVVAARREGKWTHYKISEAGAARALEMMDALFR